MATWNDFNEMNSLIGYANTQGLEISYARYDAQDMSIIPGPELSTVLGKNANLFVCRDSLTAQHFIQGFEQHRMLMNLIGISDKFIAKKLADYEFKLTKKKMIAKLKAPYYDEDGEDGEA